MIPVSSSMLDNIREHALEEYPFECCGVIVGMPGTDSNDILHRCRNIQNQLHEKDPDVFTRDARTAYYIDPKELIGIFKEADDNGLVVKVFYHSHPEHDAYFSEEDKQMAMFDGEPLYPYAGYLVISVYGRKINREAFFLWNPDSRSFREKE